MQRCPFEDGEIGHVSPSRFDPLTQLLETPVLVVEEARSSVLDRRTLAGGARDRETAAALAETFPKLADAVMAEADAALAGMLVLPGTGSRPQFVGNPPDWLANPNPGSPGDLEFVWQLNRLEHWKSLLRGALVSGEDRYRDRVVEELRDWLHRCQRPPLDLDRMDELFNESNQVKRLRGVARRLESFPAAFRLAQQLRRLGRDSQQRLGRLMHEVLRPRPAASAVPVMHRVAGENDGAVARTTAGVSDGDGSERSAGRCAVAPWRTLEAGVRMYDIWPLLFLPPR